MRLHLVVSRSHEHGDEAMMRCHQCHAPVKPTAPDGDIRYVAPADGGSRIATLTARIVAADAEIELRGKQLVAECNRTAAALEHIADLESKLGVATEARDGYKKQNEKMHDEKTAASSRIAALERPLTLPEMIPMTIFQKSSFFNSIYDGISSIPEEVYAYFRERQRSRLYDFLVGKFLEKESRNELSRADLARRLNKKPEQITRWLAAPSNWTFDTISDFALAIYGGEITFSVAPLAESAALPSHRGG